MRLIGKTVTTSCKNHLQQEEHTGIRPHPGNNIQHLLAKTPIIGYSQGSFGCPGGWIQSCRGGAQTYLQLVNMVKIQFTNSMDLLLQIQMFQDNYNLIMLNGQSRLSKDLATFMFCLSLSDSYESTAQQYLDNISAIANYKLMDIIAWVWQDKNRQKAMALGQGSSLNKFSTMKNVGQKCAKCGKMNHTTQNHWPRGKNPNKKGKGQNRSK